MARAAHTATKRVLVLGDNDMAGLAVVRSLGRAGLEVHLGTFDTKGVTRVSRYVHRIHDFGHPLREPEAFAERVIEAAEALAFDLAIPTSDPALVALMPHRERLERVCPLVAPDARGFEATNDKARTCALARECDVAIPEGVLVEDERQIPEALALEGFPLVLKPVRSVVVGRARRNDVRMARSRDAAEQWLPEMLPHGPVLVQRYTPGVGVGLCILGNEGRVVAAFQHRRVHEPPSGGASSYRVSEPLDHELLAGVTRMCRALAWTGPAMFEFKRDSEGRHVLMEVNGRLWGSLPLAIAAGVDFPQLVYDLWVRGQTPARVEYRSPVFSRYTPQEPYWLLANLRAPARRSDVIRRSLGETLAELGNFVLLREHWDIESLRDPRPMWRSWRVTAAELAADVRARRTLRRERRSLSNRATSTHPEAWRGVRNILVLCHGNINRSAVAGERLRHQFATRGSGPHIVSAGFVSETGRPSSPLSRDVAAELGVNLDSHRSRLATETLLGESDLVLLMDARNLASLDAISPEAARRAIPLGAFDGDDVEIPDPYGEDRAAFRATYQRILACCDALVAAWPD